MMDHTLLGRGNDDVNNEENVNKDQCGYEYESLKLAMKSGDIERVNILIDRYVNVNQQCGHLNNAHRIAVTHSTTEMVDLLIKKGTDVNQPFGYYGSALQAAVADSSMEVVDFLIKKGAVVNQPGGRYGNALQAAVVHSNMEMVDFLIKKGAKVNQPGGYYDNILQAAVEYRDLEIVQHLVDNGADVCLQNEFQMTALHYAVRRMEVEIVEFLLGKNARPDAKNDTGVTPFDLAIELGNTEIIQLLLPKMESAPILSSKSWRSALHLERAEALMFTFREHLSVEPVEFLKLPALTSYDEKAICIGYFHRQSDTSRVISFERKEFADSIIPKGPVHIVCDDSIPDFISPSFTFMSRWWRRNFGRKNSFLRDPEASLLPNPDLCRQLDPRD
ncbi:ankyrin repeat-containing domain protein [Xylaria flabelliformis]|nr:ankyrin repeat-containing domain protein [Xylaria flabelliformis]